MENNGILVFIDFILYLQKMLNKGRRASQCFEEDQRHGAGNYSSWSQRVCVCVSVCMWSHLDSWLRKTSLSGDIWTETWISRANQPCNELGKSVWGRANSNCKIPKARMSLTCSRSGKKILVLGQQWAVMVQGARCGQIHYFIGLLGTKGVGFYSICNGSW